MCGTEDDSCTHQHKHKHVHTRAQDILERLQDICKAEDVSYKVPHAVTHCTHNTQTMRTHCITQEILERLTHTQDVCEAEDNNTLQHPAIH